MPDFTNYFEKHKITARAVMAHNPHFVLDVGCGEGKLIKLLRDDGIDAIGIDVEKNAKYYPEFCYYGDAKNLQFCDGQFDVVVCDGVLEHIPEEDIDKVYKEMKRVGGHIILRICVKTKEWKGHITIKPISWWKEKFPNCEFIGKEWQ